MYMIQKTHPIDLISVFAPFDLLKSVHCIRMLVFLGNNLDLWCLAEVNDGFSALTIRLYDSTDPSLLSLLYVNW